LELNKKPQAPAERRAALRYKKPREDHSIAGAVQFKAPVLVLDQPTAAIDAETEARRLLAVRYRHEDRDRGRLARSVAGAVDRASRTE